MDRKISPLYPPIKALVKFFYPKTRVEHTAPPADEPVIYVANHAQLHGPIACELYLPGEHCTWCAGEMMHLKEVPDYAYRDFWQHKPRCIRWFFRLLSYLIAPLSVVVFNSANTIGVYHDSRILSTFRQTVQQLQQGRSVVIFPEHGEGHNSVINDFQDRFVDVARLYYSQTGKELLFVPLYIAPKLGTLYIGEGVRFNAGQPLTQERQRIVRAMMDGVTALARRLPRHTVVPYGNIPKHCYPQNLVQEPPQEQTCC